MVRKYGVDKANSQFYTKYITKLSFVLKITQFLVSEPFFFYHRGKKVSSQRAKPFCMLFIFAVKTQLKYTHAHLTKKLRLVFLVEMTCFLRNRSLEFHEIWQNSRSLNAYRNSPTNKNQNLTEGIFTKH